jgi:hypothetical protein
MKHFVAATLVVLFGALGWAHPQCVHTDDTIGRPVPPDIGSPIPTNPDTISSDDLVPWPWGTECVFPWDKVDGEWKVKGKYGQQYDRDTLVFETAEDVKAGIKLLYIYHYNDHGQVIGQGTGFGDRDNKVIKAIMTNSNGRGFGYQIMVRTYSRIEGASCRMGKLSMAATFCPPRGKKCLENQNYLLMK